MTGTPADLSHTDGTLSAIRSSAARAGAVWSFYAIVESTLAISLPLLRRFAVSHGVALPMPIGGEPAVSSLLTCFVLAVYPSVGALIGTAAGWALTRRHRGLFGPSVPEAGRLAAATASLGVALLFCIAGLASTQRTIAFAGMLPVALGIISIRRAIATSSEHSDARTGPVAIVWTHPISIVGLAVFGGIVARISRASQLRTVVAVGTFSATYLATVFLFSQLRALRRMRVYLNHRFSRGPLPMIFASTAVVVLNVVANASPIMIRQEQRGMPGRVVRPNVILITMDTVRADHLSLYGYYRNTTPALRRFVLGGAILYRNAVAASNWTLPGHAAIFTGQFPRRNGAHESTDAMHRSSVGSISQNSSTLAELLARSGYRTLAVVANTAVMNHPLGFDRGFSIYRCVWPSGFYSPALDAFPVRALAQKSVRWAVGHESEFARADAVNSVVEDFFETDAREPFFLFINYMDAHSPYTPPHPFDRLYPGRDPTFTWRRYEDVVSDVTWWHKRPITAREARHLISQYDGAISYLDRELGALLSKLKASGMLERSIIVITSDHGEGFGGHFVVGHGTSVYQSQVHVPLIIKLPGRRAPVEDRTVVSAVDISPTILGLIGIPAPPHLDGSDLFRLGQSGQRAVIAEAYGSRTAQFVPTDKEPAEVAMYAGRFKSIMRADGHSELYDLKADPMEHLNVGPKLPGVARELHDAYAAVPWPIQVESPLASPEAVRQMRALGYLH